MLTSTPDEASEEELNTGEDIDKFKVEYATMSSLNIEIYPSLSRRRYIKATVFGTFTLLEHAVQEPMSVAYFVGNVPSYSFDHCGS